MKQFSPEAISALKEALTHIYWKRKDIKTFVYHTMTSDNKTVLKKTIRENVFFTISGNSEILQRGNL